MNKELLPPDCKPSPGDPRSHQTGIIRYGQLNRGPLRCDGLALNQNQHRAKAVATAGSIVVGRIDERRERGGLGEHWAVDPAVHQVRVAANTLAANLDLSQE